MKQHQANDLFNKYQQGKCTEEELSLLESWYNLPESEPLAFNADEILKAKAEVWQKLPLHQPKKTIKLWRTVGIAASLLLAISIGFVVFSQRNKAGQDLTASNDIKPGGKNATLKLADGREIILNNLATGEVLQQEGLKITKTANGQLIYTVQGSADHEALAFNSISTPLGGTYQVILPDGTKVWLNSASSLKYPTAFKDNKREVELVGEGYFEVAHNAQKPFHVITKTQDIAVLGTHFNLSAYPDDDFAKTTLYEGKVEVRAQDQVVVLKPNEQAVLQGGKLLVKQIDNEGDLAWKNNEFSFSSERLGEILKKLGRWYDVEFECPKDLENLEFGGYISRDKSLKQALNMIDQEGTVHFKIEGRKITAMK
ncbi:FecR family protein [Pedobacter sp. HDW13]|uniref:FecR family protein n=1 Tax=unclassified Pedobacter TaxID=2628915 RepID=UPI000F5A945E|nr:MULTISPECIES: FecR family protein [unclassified Pedobacter]QIL42357.1 FecR family protein [Pedobacter sp. HDW13]RQO78862.1 anti-sigma factor [Pedobacter sp. KBW01]